MDAALALCWSLLGPGDIPSRSHCCQVVLTPARTKRIDRSCFGRGFFRECTTAIVRVFCLCRRSTHVHVVDDTDIDAMHAWHDKAYERTNGSTMMAPPRHALVEKDEKAANNGRLGAKAC